MTILQILGFDKSQSNEIFTVKTSKKIADSHRAPTSAKSSNTNKLTLVLKQSQGYPKEYSGISRVLDITEHSV